MIGGLGYHCMAEQYWKENFESTRYVCFKVCCTPDEGGKRKQSCREERGELLFVNMFWQPLAMGVLLRQCLALGTGGQTHPS